MKKGVLWKGKTLARHLGVSYGWLLKASQKGEVPSFSVGRDIRFNLEDVLHAMKKDKGRRVGK